MKIHLITIGKLKNKEIKSLCYEYEKRLKRIKVVSHEVKASSDEPEKEGRLAIKKIKDISSEKSLNILLTERGDTFTSKNLSLWFEKKFHKHPQINIIIAGAMGPSQELENASHYKLSLSPLTFPHQLARLLIIEQIYRVESILNNHPYHN